MITYMRSTHIVYLLHLVLCTKVPDHHKHCFHSPLFPLQNDHSQHCSANTSSFTPSLFPIAHLSTTALSIKNPAGPCHSTPRSWHERDFCLMNLPTSLSRGYLGTRLDRKRLAREVMISRRPPLVMSSAVVPGGQGDWPRASRTAYSSSSEVRWSREAEISRYRQL